ncbi:TPA: hypothetical protein KAK57_004700 [Escherichia coli]|nr:hypothetical protein [Escherichia coli]
MFKNIVGGVFPRSEELFSIRSRFSNWKKFLQAYRGNYYDGAYTPPGLMISGTTVIHGLFTDNQHLFLGITPLYIHQQCAHDKGYCHERIALTS